MTRRGGLHFRSGIAARILLASIVVSTAAVVAAVPAHAACNSPVDQIDAAARADSVFVGLVTNVSDSSRKATIQVLETWKGPDLPAEVSVNGSFAGSSAIGPNDRTFTLGATYLLIPFGSRPPFFDEACSGTGLYVPAGGVIPARFHDAVGATTARLTDILGIGDESTVGGGPTRLLIGGGVAGLFLLLSSSHSSSLPGARRESQGGVRRSSHQRSSTRSTKPSASRSSSRASGITPTTEWSVVSVTRRPAAESCVCTWPPGRVVEMTTVMVPSAVYM